MAFDFAAAVSEELPSAKDIKLQKLSYVREDGIIALSYSKLETFYACPRRFQLGEVEDNRFRDPSAHTAYGHAVGAGIAVYLLYAPKPIRADSNFEKFDWSCSDEAESVSATPDEEAAWKRAHDNAIARAVFAGMQAWDHPDLFCADAKDKTIEDAVYAIRLFANTTAQTILQDWEVAHLRCNGGVVKPAIELTFYVGIHERYSYQGHIDIVLRHRADRRLSVWEVKTSAKEIQQADWENSAQTLGYNVILQGVGEITDDTHDYEVHYICYNTGDRKFYILDFKKPVSIRAEFVATLMLDIQQIQCYIDNGLFPKRGSKCVSYGRACRFFGNCDLVTRQSLQGDSAYSYMARDEVDFVLTIDDLLRLQAIDINGE